VLHRSLRGQLEFCSTHKMFGAASRASCLWMSPPVVGNVYV